MLCYLVRTFLKISKQSFLDSFNSELFINEIEQLPAIWDSRSSSWINKQGKNQCIGTLCKIFVENFDENPSHLLTDGGCKDSKERQHRLWEKSLRPGLAFAFSVAVAVSVLAYCSKGPVPFSKTTVCSVIKILCKKHKRICRPGVHKFFKTLGSSAEF